MGDIGNLVVKATLNTSGLKAGTSEAIGQLNRLEGSLGGIATAVKGVFALEAVQVGMNVVRKGLELFNDLRNEIDETSKSARKLGFSVQELRELKLAGGLAGVDAGTLETSVRQMQNRIADAVRGKGDAADTLGELGLDPSKLKAAGPKQAILEIADALGGVENEADRIRIAMDLFGKSGADMLSLMEGGAAGLRSQLESAGGILGTMTQEEADAVERLNDNLDRLWAGMKANAGIGLGKLAKDIESGNSWASMAAEATGLGGVAQYWRDITAAYKDQEAAAARNAELEKKMAEMPTTYAGKKKAELEAEKERYAQKKELNTATEAGLKLEEQLSQKLQAASQGDFAAKLQAWVDAALKAGVGADAISQQVDRIKQLNQELEKAEAKQKRLKEAQQMVDRSLSADDKFSRTLKQLEQFQKEGLINSQQYDRLYRDAEKEHQRGLRDENPLIEKADKAREFAQSHLEKFDQQIRELEAMVAQGLLTREEARAAALKHADEYSGTLGSVGEHPQALVRGTAEAYNASIAAPEAEQKEYLRQIAVDHLAELRAHTAQLQAIANKQPKVANVGR